jgi:hypothetical protein
MDDTCYNKGKEANGAFRVLASLESKSHEKD